MINKYNIKCNNCNEIVERSKKRIIATCFFCKAERHKLNYFKNRKLKNKTIPLSEIKRKAEIKAKADIWLRD